MEELFSRYPHISEKIFQQLDDKSLTNCREVSKSWQEFLDSKNMSWIRIVDFPTSVAFGNKYISEVRYRGNTYLHLASVTGQLAMFVMIFECEEIKNPSNSEGKCGDSCGI